MPTRYEDSLDFARQMDAEDPLRQWRAHFYFPRHEGREVWYFCGNSLGLQPRGVAEILLEELEHWRMYGVEGHFKGKRPWMYYHKFLLPQTAALVGAKEEEVVVMNTLTTNLHLLMVTFYRPTAERFKIIMEAGAFPSDQYAVETQVRWHGFDPEEAVVEVCPRPGEETLRTEDILATIERHGDQTALVLFGGVNYYTGQFFDLKAITEAAHAEGAYAGFDLAHAAGNVPLQLHDWGVDFACWCSYKYLNSGPGGPSGIFIHERHGNDTSLPRFGGWWGHDEETRFLMQKGFKPMRGAAGWQLSNAQIMAFAPHLVSLDIFHQVGMEALRAKSLLLTGYLEYLLNKINEERQRFRIITPADPAQRGCQLSIAAGAAGKGLFEYLSKRGVVADWREPEVIRVAPVPLYNSFEDVWHLARLMREGTANQ
ncbi:MAG: kynureninase [Saprospiraceae bacterium]|nr:MAG: kynureninase [Saprospiraceae bacterium]